MTTTNTFIKENFSYSGGYLTYDDGADDRKISHAANRARNQRCHDKTSERERYTLTQ